MRIAARACCLAFAPGLFAAVPAAATPGWFDPVTTLPSASGQAGVALGDLDADGDIDAYIVGRTVPDVAGFGAERPSPDRLLRNDAGTLVDAGAGPDAAAPDAGSGDVVLIDVDLDGDLDAIVAGGDYYTGVGGGLVQSPTRIWRNSGSGALATRLGQPSLLPGGVRRMAVADIDRDGDADVGFSYASGTVRVYVNQGGAQGASAGTFLAGPSYAGTPGFAAEAVAFGQFGGDANLDLVYHESVAAGSTTLRVRRYVGGAGLFEAGAVAVPLPDAGGGLLGLPVPREIRALAIDADSYDDLVVATTEGVYVLLARPLPDTTPAFIEAPQQYPQMPVDALAALDAEDDGAVDLAFSVSGLVEQSSLRIWSQQGSARFEARSQCFGSASFAALAAADLDGDLQDDIVAVGRGGTRVFGNDGLFLREPCCASETAAFSLFDSTQVKRGAAGLKSLDDAYVDLATLFKLRERSLRATPDGRRMIANYESFSTEVSTLLAGNATLRRQARDVLSVWRTDLVALNRWRGDDAIVDSTQVEAMDQFLLALSAAGSPALAQMIAAERALQPPFDQFIGLSMSEFRELTIDFPILFGDGFED